MTADSRPSKQARWQAWLEERVLSGKEITEWDAAEELTKYREPMENFASVRMIRLVDTGHWLTSSPAHDRSSPMKTFPPPARTQASRTPT